MTTVKVMSILNCAIFNRIYSSYWLSPVDEFDLTVTEENMMAAMGMSIILIIYGIAYSITCLVQSNKYKKIRPVSIKGEIVPLFRFVLKHEHAIESHKPFTITMTLRLF